MAVFTSEKGKLYIDGNKIIKGWESFTGWYWFAIRIAWMQTSIISEREYPNDTIFYGFIQGHVEEYGNFSLAELNRGKPLIWKIPNKNLTWSGRRTPREVL